MAFALDIITDLSGFNENQVNSIFTILEKQNSITAEEIYQLLFSK